MRIINKDENEIYKTKHGVQCDFCGHDDYYYPDKEPRTYFVKKDAVSIWFSKKIFGIYIYDDKKITDAVICNNCVRDLAKELK